MMKNASRCATWSSCAAAARCCAASTSTIPAGGVTGLLGPVRLRQDHADARARRRAAAHVAARSTVLGEPAGQRAAARPGRLRHPGRRACTTTSPSPRTSRFFARVLGVDRPTVGRGASTPSTSPTTPTRSSAGSPAASGRRVSLAVALLGEPDLLVLDEPTVGLDPVLRRDLWELFHRLADGGAAVLVSSHVMDEAERCDRLLLMREGADHRRRHPRRDPRAHRRRRHRARPSSRLVEGGERT